MREYLVVIERDEEGALFASFPQLPGCHTCGDSIQELLENAKEAVALYLDTEGEDFIPEVVDVRRIAV